MKAIKASPFWTTQDLSEAQNATTYEQLADFAIRALMRQWDRLPADNYNQIAVVSGTLTNGGTLPYDVVQENIRNFGRMIAKLRQLGIPIWDQRPFEKHLFRIKALPENVGKPMKLLNEFYRPVFESGLITLAFMLPNWKESHGAKWERRLFWKLGVSTFFVN
jgi:hypothetical protein